MITAIFKKSKPINIVVVVLFVMALYVAVNFNAVSEENYSYFQQLAKLFIVMFAIFLLEFIVSKNKLTKRNSYAIMTFALLLALFPKVLMYLHLIVANLFIMFALRRLISLHSKLNIKKKLFDAGFWMALASLFYVWALLFFVIIIVALIYYWQNDIKNAVIPFLGVLTVAIILVTFNIMMHGDYLQDNTFIPYSSLNFSAYNSASGILTLTIGASMFVWMAVYYFKQIKDRNKTLRPVYFLIVWSAIIAVLVAVISPVKDGSEFIFLLAPFSIMMSNYIERIEETWFREVFVSLLIITPLLRLVL
ncbi:DUF6427 family protein [Winogradskyella maritima]|uniref:DUF6427 family protein n=1 Tax=Winogradskyella maritima TaxID=1517766 RepID=A0ABV8ADK2_9FLAO|nr:DUF6427 family protein [Winogradskyella maritima]